MAFSFTDLLRPKSSELEATGAKATDQLSRYKQDAIDAAKTAAEAEGRKPTMSDYYIAAEQLGESKKTEMASQGIEWNPKIYADVRGQKFDGFLIRKQEIEPSADVEKAALALAYKQTGNAQPTRIEIYTAMRQTNDLLQKGEISSQQKDMIKEVENLFDLDGDHTIGNLYKQIASQSNFEGTSFANVTFHPAGTLTQFHSDGASFEHVTFDGMSAETASKEGDTVLLKNGSYKNITFTNISGGQIQVAERTQINGMNISGQTAELVVGKMANIENLNAHEANIVRLNVGEGAVIRNSKFDGATIDMASSLQGSTWNKVTFDKANLVHVELDGAALNDVTFNGTDLSHTSFKKAKLNDVKINDTVTKNVDLTGANIKSLTVNGKKIDTATQLTELGIKFDNTTTLDGKTTLLDANTQQGIDKAKAMAALIRKEAASWNVLNDPHKPAPAPEPKQQPVQQAPLVKEAAVGFDGTYTQFMNTDIAKASEAKPEPQVNGQLAMAQALAAKRVEKSEAFDPTFYARKAAEAAPAPKGKTA